VGSSETNLTYSIRTLVKNIGFTGTAVWDTRVRIGAMTAISAWSMRCSNPMPYPKPDQLVSVRSKIQGGELGVGR
jgi:hypothetical protein